MFRTFMELIFMVSVAVTALAFIFIPCVIMCLGLLLVLGIYDRFVSPVVAYIAFPEAVMISVYLLLHYWRQITESSN